MSYAEIVGQEDVIARLKAFSDFYASSGCAPEHILITGEDGMGKRTLARAFASEMRMPLQAIDATDLEVIADLTALLTNLRNQQVLLMSNVSSLRKPLLDTLLSAMRDYAIKVIIGRRGSSRTHRLDVPRFTFIATAAKKTDCSADCLSRFSLVLPLQPYSVDELRRIAQAIARKRGITLETRAAELLAANCNGCPRQVEVLMQRLMPTVKKDAILEESTLTEEGTLRALSAFGINARSTDPGDSNSVWQMSGQDFERLIAALLTRMGFHAETTRVTGDGGIDIVAFLDKPILGGKYLFQCKRFAPDNLVGAPTVRDFYGAVTADRAVKGVFITTSSFTLQAREFAQKVGLELIGWKELQSLMAEYEMRDMPPSKR